eukprot:80561_1
MTMEIESVSIIVAISSVLFSAYVWYSHRGASNVNTGSKARNASSKLSASSLLEFAYLIGNLKRTERSGWVRKNIHKPESVADHMYRMSLLAWLFSDQFNNYDTSNTVQVNEIKIIKMALVHDVIESICGDIIPIEKISGVSKETKHQLEHNSIIKIRDEYLKGSAVGKEMYDLWIEYEEQNTLESHIVKDLDKLDMIIQAEEYENAKENNGITLNGFFQGTRGIFQTEIGKHLDAELMRQR